MVPRFVQTGPIMRHLEHAAPAALSPPSPLVTVDRAVSELRRGGVVGVRADANALVLVLAAEAVTPEALSGLAGMAGTAPALVVTGRRAAVLGLCAAEPPAAVVRLSGPDLTAEDIARLADPCSRLAADRGLARLVPEDAAADGAMAAAVALTKLARLLPAAVLAETRPGFAPGDMPVADAADALNYQQTAARTLTAVSEARVPLKDAENSRIVAFRPADGGVEHLAIVIGEPDVGRPVLTRLHSECFTGDLLASLRCDCGDQLRGAIAEIARAGSGVLLYLAQEGRGIGLVNKLRAYRLQDTGFDTLDANLQLGFDDDERIYQPAAQMLRLLGIATVRLMTNNPGKVEALARHGIGVAERVPHVFPVNDHNAFYLSTKASRGGHLF